MITLLWKEAMLSYLKNLSLFLLGIIIFCPQVYAKEKHTFPAIWNIPKSNEYFTGRQKVLKSLHDDFRKGKHTITIVGSAGIGKTQLAKRFAEVYRTDYDIVWWIDAEKDIDEQFSKLATEWNNLKKNSQINTFLSIPELIQQLQDKLRTTELSWLIIFDNAFDRTKINNYIPDKHNKNGYGDVLITSKNPTLWSDIMVLDKFTRDESIELLVKITNENNKEAANMLADIFKDYPLALVQAASYIKAHPSINMDDYKNLFLTKREQLWKEENSSIAKSVAFDNYKFTISTTMSLALKEIEKESPEALNLLAFCSFLNSKSIPKSLLTYYLKLITKADPLKQEEIISILLKYSLIQLQKNNLNYAVEHLSKDIIEGLNIVFNIHEVTQITVQDYFSDKEKEDYLTKGINILAQFLPDKLDIYVPLVKQANFILEHINVISKNAAKQKIYNKDLITLYLRELEYYLPGNKEFTISKQLIDKIEEALLKTPKDNLILARFHIMKSVFSAWSNSNYHEGIKEAHNVLKLLDEVKGEYNEEYLTAYNSLIHFYNHLGDKENALKYAQLGKELVNNSKGFLGNQDSFFYGLAKIYLDDEQFEEALYYINKAEKLILERKGGLMIGDFPNFFMKTDILLRMEKYKEAFSKIEAALKLAKEIFQHNEHFCKSVTMIFYNYSSFLINNKKPFYSEERHSILKAQDTLKRLLDAQYHNNRYVALSHRFLGEVYEAEKDYVKAQAEYALAEQIFSNIYGSNKVATHDTGEIYSKLAMINIKLKEPVTAQAYLTKLQERFGYNHPRTLKVTNYFTDSGVAVGF